MATNSGTSGSFQSPSKQIGFSQVRFICIPETFTAGADVQCSFVVSEEMEINSRDWVGLYKVGWRSSSDYVYYEWSLAPSNYVSCTEVAGRVLFPGNMIIVCNSKLQFLFSIRGHFSISIRIIRLIVCTNIT